MSDLSRRLSTLRRESELDVTEVAKRIGLGKHLLEGFERGTCRPMRGSLKALAVIYKVNYRELWRLLDEVESE